MPRNDFNGDGRSDILWRRFDGTVSNWLGQPNGSFLVNDAAALRAAPTDWRVFGTGDFNGDGRDDIAWYNVVTTAMSNWLGTADGGFVVNDSKALLNLPNPFQIAGVGDFDGDGNDELLIFATGSSGGVIDIVHTFGDGVFEFSDTAFGEFPLGWSIVGTGDFDGNGRDDILWRHEDGRVSNWLSSAPFNTPFGSGFVVNDSNALTQVSTQWHVVGIGDFNGDGRDDVLWRHEDGRISNWLGQPNGGFFVNDSNAMSPAPLSWAVEDTGDYNADGRDDILWRHIATGQVSNWLGTPAGGFSINDAAAIRPAPLDWQVQPNPSGEGEWDYF